MFTKTVFILTITALATLAGTGFFNTIHQQDTTYAETVGLFNKWAIMYHKTYQSPEERNYRLSIFHKNLVMIEEHNRVNTSFKRGINKFSDLLPEEFKTKYLGYNFSSERVRNEVPFVEKSIQNPVSVDWVKAGIVGPIKNQGQCGSSWAFSATCSLQARWAQTKGLLLNFSEQQLVDCSSSYGNEGCNGGSTDFAFKYIQANGITTEENYPYHARTSNCKYNKKPIGTMSGFVDVPHNNGQALEDAVAKRVVSVLVEAANWSSYSHGIYNSNCGTQFNYSTNVVGYGSDGDIEYWIVKNGWGEGWGEFGFIRILKSTAMGPGQCGINTAASYPLV